MKYQEIKMLLIFITMEYGGTLLGCAIAAGLVIAGFYGLADTACQVPQTIAVK